MIYYVLVLIDYCANISIRIYTESAKIQILQDFFFYFWRENSNEIILSNFQTQ